MSATNWEDVYRVQTERIAELEREIASLRAHAERVGQANDRLIVENAALRKAKEMVELERCEMMRSMSLAQNQSEQLRADKERLDYVEKHLGLSRDALDVAMEVSQP